MPGHPNQDASAPDAASGPAPAVAIGRNRWRVWRRRCAVLAVVAGALWWVGCTSLVRPPASPTAPQSVFIVENALHRGLVLPLPAPDSGAPGAEGTRPRVERRVGYVEFSYGDWGWYAEGRDAWYQVFPTVLWPTPGGLGRRTFGARDGDELAQRMAPAVLQELVVERAAVDALRTRLQQRWEAARDGMPGGPQRSYGLDFVRDDGGYWAFNNCADAVAGWLEELDCAVGWVPLRLSLSVEVLP